MRFFMLSGVLNLLRLRHGSDPLVGQPGLLLHLSGLLLVLLGLPVVQELDLVQVRVIKDLPSDGYTELELPVSFLIRSKDIFQHVVSTLQSWASASLKKNTEITCPNDLSEYYNSPYIGLT